MALPPSLLPLLGQAGLTEDDLDRLARVHGIETEDDCLAACRTNRLRDDRHFGQERQSLIQGALRTTAWSTPARHIAQARDAAARVLTALQDDPSAVRLAPVGGVRRMDPWVEEVELLASAHEPASLLDAFARIRWLRDVTRNDDERANGRLRDGTPVSLRVLPETATGPGAYLVHLIRATGPAAHVEALERRAAELGLDYGPDGLRHADAPLPLAWEPDVYTALELPTYPPECRWMDLDAPPPEDLVDMRGVRGLVHVHTDARAGSAPLEGYARAAAQAGYDWVLVAEGDPDPATLAAHAEAHRALPEDVPVKVVLGAEVDLSVAAGDAACASGIAGADVLLAKVGRGEATAAALRAAESPHLHVLAHPDRRSTIDWEAVLPALARTDTALEISAESTGADLDAVLPEALRRGVKLFPAADAHDLGAIDRAIVAVGQARRAGARMSDVLTTLSARKFRAWARR